MRRLIRWFFFGSLLLAVAGIAGLVWMFATRPALEGYQAHLYPAAKGNGSRTLTAAWFGTTAILLDDGESAIFVDPFFTRPGGWREMMLNRPIAPDEALIRAWLDKAGVSRLDAVVVTHSHYDHSMDAGVVAQMTGAMLFGSDSTANVGRGGGLAENRMTIFKPGKPVRFGNFTVTPLQSRHTGATGGRPTGDITEPLVPPARYIDYKQGGTFGLVIEHALGTIVHHGSAGWAPDMYQGRQAQVAFLGIAAPPPLDQYFAATVDPLGTSRVIPTHWDDFTRPLDQPLLSLPFGADLGQFLVDAKRARPQLRVYTLEPGRRVTLFPEPEVPPPS